MINNPLTRAFLFLFFVSTHGLAQQAAICLTSSASVGTVTSFKLSMPATSTIQVDFGDGVLVPKTVQYYQTTISDTLRGSTIKIYGDNITYLGSYAGNFTALDVTNSPTLEEISFSTNNLSVLDLHNNTALKNLYIANNKLPSIDLKNCTKLERLDIGGNSMTSLDLSANTVLDAFGASFHSFTSLDFSNCPLLTRVDCRIGPLASINVSKCPLLNSIFLYNNKLTSLDVTQNKELDYLWCNFNKITELDVSQNSKLTELNCNGNQISVLDVSRNSKLSRLFCATNVLTNIDVRNNTALTYLYCDGNKLTDVDVSLNKDLKDLQCSNNSLSALSLVNNTALTRLEASANLIKTLDVSVNTLLTELLFDNNKLTQLDISKNTALTKLTCSYNLLTALNITNNTDLSSLYCGNNYLKFSTLPPKTAKLTGYYYSGQRPIVMPQTFYVGEEIELSSEAVINGVNTIYTWKTKKNGTVLVENVDYTNVNGLFSFLKPQSDSVYCEMTNTTFPNFTGYSVLKTTNISIKIDPTIPQQQEIALTAGWNLISTYLRPTVSSIPILVAGLGITEIKTSDAFWRANQAAYLNSLTHIQSGTAYWVYATASTSITITGLINENPPAPAGTRSGWQMIGCPYPTSIPLSNLFNSFNCKELKNLTGFWKPYNAQSSITLMEPGKGYLLKK